MLTATKLQVLKPHVFLLFLYRDRVGEVVGGGSVVGCSVVQPICKVLKEIVVVLVKLSKF